MCSKPNPPASGRRTSPSYSGFLPASELTSRVKQRNHKTGTKAELALRHALWRRGLRYRLNRRGLPGTPDIVFAGRRTVVFVDGDFWHGRDWEKRKERLGSGSNGAYWVSKIAYNRERDRRNDTLLTEMGWQVLRLWETDVLKNPDSAADLIAAMIQG
jgi:DNA mismatch endonuclease (patch repair protein)